MPPAKLSPGEVLSGRRSPRPLVPVERVRDLAEEDAIVAAFSHGSKSFLPTLPRRAVLPNHEPAFLDEELHPGPEACLLQELLGDPNAPRVADAYAVGAHVCVITL